MSQPDLLSQLHIDRETVETSSHPKRWWLIALTVLIVLGVLLAAVLRYTRVHAPLVTVAQALPAIQETGNVSVLDATGYITARRMATVSSKITGKVNEIFIEEGMQVTANQVLATLDDTDVKAQLNLAQAQLEASMAQQAELRILLDEAKRQLARQQELMAKKLTSQQLLETTQTEVQRLTAQSKTLAQQIKVSKQQLSIVQVAVDNTIIRAPFTGVITVKAAQPGEIISPVSAGGGFTRTGIGTIVDMESLEIQVDVNESFIQRVTPGQPAEATLNAYPDWKIPAQVAAIIPTADRSKATVKVRITLLQKDPRILPDMGVRVAFLNTAQSTKMQKPMTLPGVLVPTSAVQHRDDKDFVYVYYNNHVEQRNVELGTVINNMQQILSGLTQNESVVLNPPDSLRSGTIVQLAPSH